MFEITKMPLKLHFRHSISDYHGPATLAWPCSRFLAFPSCCQQFFFIHVDKNETKSICCAAIPFIMGFLECMLSCKEDSGTFSEHLQSQRVTFRTFPANMSGTPTPPTGLACLSSSWFMKENPLDDKTTT